MSDRMTRYRVLIDEYLVIVLQPGPAWESNPRRVAISDECGRMWDRMSEQERREVYEYQRTIYEQRVYGR